MLPGGKRPGAERATLRRRRKSRLRMRTGIFVSHGEHAVMHTGPAATRRQVRFHFVLCMRHRRVRRRERRQTQQQQLQDGKQVAHGSIVDHVHESNVPRLTLMPAIHGR